MGLALGMLTVFGVAAFNVLAICSCLNPLKPSPSIQCWVGRASKGGGASAPSLPVGRGVTVHAEALTEAGASRRVKLQCPSMTLPSSMNSKIHPIYCPS